MTGAAGAARAPRAAKPSVAKGFTITKLALAPTGAGNCDDNAFLGGNLYVGCHNKTLSSGGGGKSTLVEYSTAGKVLKTWSIKGQIAGIGADPLKRYLIVSLNEDAHRRTWPRSRRRLLPLCK